MREDNEQYQWWAKYKKSTKFGYSAERMQKSISIIEEIEKIAKLRVTIEKIWKSRDRAEKMEKIYKICGESRENAKIHIE